LPLDRLGAVSPSTLAFDKLTALPPASLRDGEQSRTVSEAEGRAVSLSMGEVVPRVLQCTRTGDGKPCD